MKQYSLVVGNIGEVWSGNNPIDAQKEYGEYKRLSVARYGRAAGESVTLFCDNEIELEHIGEQDLLNNY